MKKKKIDTKDILMYLFIVITGAAAFLWMVQPVFWMEQAERTSHPVRVYERDVETLVYGHDNGTDFVPGVYTGGLVIQIEEVKGGRGMEYAQVKEYLDDMVRDYRNAIKPRCLADCIRSSVSIDKDILVHKGLEIIADIMGLEIQEEERNVSSGLVYEYSFVYEGVKFVGYEKERMKRFRNNL